MGQEDIMSTAEDVADQVPNNGRALMGVGCLFGVVLFLSSSPELLLGSIILAG